MKKAALGGLVLALGLAFAAVPANTLLYMQSADIPTLDPGATYDTASGALVENIYETLVTYKGRASASFSPFWPPAGPSPGTARPTPSPCARA
jgi:peptide/nickel transport system substrate-binding protein